MISITLQGGLGNNLFQQSVVLSYSLKHNVDYCIPKKVINPHYVGQQPYIFPGIKYCDKPLSGEDVCIYNEPFFHYQEIPKSDCEKYLLNGYFQSYRYFDEFREEILKAFDFKYQFDKGVCCIHVRRGDYLLYPDHHPFVGEEYLRTAVMLMFKERGIKHFRVFSNDIDWCIEFFGTEPELTLDCPDLIFDFAKGNNEIQDLEQGSFCETQILSNGTFSLWQYYLNQNPNKICIAPKIWFGKALDHDTKDLYPEGSILL